MAAPNRYGSNLIKAQIVYVTNLQGENGFTYITGTAAFTPTEGRKNWRSIHFLEASTITALSAIGAEGANLNTIAPAGAGDLFGSFTNIQLATGSAIAYY